MWPWWDDVGTPASLPTGKLIAVPDRPIITAEEMDRMTPGERAALVEAGTILSLDDLPKEFRHRLEVRANELNEQLRSNTSA